jgi:hypothetical protein
MICLEKSLGFWLLELIYKQVDPDLGGNLLRIHADPDPKH